MSNPVVTSAGAFNVRVNVTPVIDEQNDRTALFLSSRVAVQVLMAYQ
jgi:hypothetical protein